MRLASTLLAIVCLLSFAIAGHATTIGPGTYNLENAFVDGYSVTGTITFDSSSVATAVNLSFNDPAYAPGATVFGNIVQSDTYTGLGQNYFTAINNGTGGQIGLYFTNTADSNGNFNLCLNNGPCGAGSGDSTLQLYGYNVNGYPWYVQGFGPDNFTSGYLSAVATSPGVPSIAATPEPSSLLLLGTGVLGCAGAMRRRFIKS